MNSDTGFSVIDIEVVSKLGFLQIENHTVRGPAGETADRIVIRHPGAVAVVPIIDGNVILIEQYRAPVDDVVLEIPAGKLDVGDVSTEAAARRELLEETGFNATTLTELTAILTAVGFTNEKITIYLAEGLEPGETQPDGIEEHSATVVTMPFSEAVDRVVSGEIQDAKTIAGILVADAHRRARP